MLSTAARLGNSQEHIALSSQHQLTRTCQGVTRSRAPHLPAARAPRCTRCQLFGTPSFAEYMHMGDRKIRLGISKSRSFRGVKSAGIPGCHLVVAIVATAREGLAKEGVGRDGGGRLVVNAAFKRGQSRGHAFESWWTTLGCCASVAPGHAISFDTHRHVCAFERHSPA